MVSERATQPFLDPCIVNVMFGPVMAQEKQKSWPAQEAGGESRVTVVEKWSQHQSTPEQEAPRCS